MIRVAEELVEYLGVTPQPVAWALGRVVRAHGSAPRLEACVKAAEVVTRYTAVLGLASAASPADDAVAPLKVDGFNGNLSFGSFETAARIACATKWDHPLRDRLRACLRSTSKKGPVAGARLPLLVKLRNELGHALTPADEQRARAIFERDDPIGCLIEVIAGLEPILSLPLMVVLHQQHRRGRFQSRMMFYVGEAEPIPRDVPINRGIYEWESPYLCTESGLIPLSAGLLLHPQADGRFGFHFIDSIAETEARYKSVNDNSVVATDRTMPDLLRWLELPKAGSHPIAGPGPRMEEVDSEDGRTLLAYVRGDPRPAGVTEEPGGQSKTPSPSAGMLTVSDFERRASAAGFGTAYRDIVYFLLELGHKCEATDTGIRVVTTSEPTRVLLTAALRSGPELVVTVLSGAFPNRSEEEPHTEVIKPDQSGDAVIDLLQSLMHPGD